LSDLQCTIQNYPNHIFSALGDKMFFRVQFCNTKRSKVCCWKSEG